MVRVTSALTTFLDFTVAESELVAILFTAAGHFRFREPAWQQTDSYS